MPDERRPFRPPRPSVPEDLQEVFLQEWWEDRREGRTTKSMHEMLKVHIEKDEEHQQTVIQKIASLETNEKRNAEDRVNGTGRFGVVPVYGPPSPVAKSVPPKDPWWSKDPFKKPLSILLTVIATGIAIEIAHKLGVPVPH